MFSNQLDALLVTPRRTTDGSCVLLGVMRTGTSIRSGISPSKGGPTFEDSTMCVGGRSGLFQEIH